MFPRLAQRRLLAPVQQHGDSEMLDRRAVPAAKHLEQRERAVAARLLARGSDKHLVERSPSIIVPPRDDVGAAKFVIDVLPGGESWLQVKGTLIACWRHGHLANIVVTCTVDYTARQGDMD